MAEKLVKQDEETVVDTAATATVEEPPKPRFEDDINELKASIAGLAESVRSLSVPTTRTETPTPQTSSPGTFPGDPTPEQLQAHYQQVKRAADEQGLDGEFVANNALAEYNAKRATRLKEAAEEKARSHYHSVVAKYPTYKDSYDSFMSLVRQSDPTAIITNQTLPDGSQILDILLDRAQGKISRERLSAKPDSLKPPEPTPESGAKSAGAIISKEGKAVVAKSRSKEEQTMMAQFGITEEQMQVEDERYSMGGF